MRNSYSYTSFGTILSQSGSAPNDHTYTGEQSDLSGLTYDRARYYDPSVGRFISRDSFAGVATSPSTLNRYVYANNDPGLYNDPSGHIPFLIGLAGAFAVGAVINFAGQAINNYIHKGSSHTFDNIDGRQVLAGGIAGAAGFVTAGAVSGLIGEAAMGSSGLWKVAFSGASSGVVAAGTEYVVDNALGVKTDSLTIQGVLEAAAFGAITGIAFHFLGGARVPNLEEEPTENNVLESLSENNFPQLPSGYIGRSHQLPLPSEGKLPISSLRYSQSTISPQFAEGPKAGKLVIESANAIREGTAPQYPVTVFIKTPEMDGWEMTSITTRSGKVYTGSYANLENYKIYVKNNRGFTEAILSGTESVNYRLASVDEIIKYSFQFDTPNGGVSAIFKDTENQGIVRVPHV